jgi:hypothetical protein
MDRLNLAILDAIMAVQRLSVAIDLMLLPGQNTPLPKAKPAPNFTSGGLPQSVTFLALNTRTK